MRRALVLCLVAVCACHGAVRPAPPRDPRVSTQRAAPEEDTAEAATVEVAEVEDFDRPWGGGANAKMPPEELPDAAVDAAAKAALAEGKASASRPPVPASPWDKKTPPKYLDLVTEHLGMTGPERDMLAKNGFVVPLRHAMPSYGYAMHEVHRQELPLYVSADAVLQSIFLSHEHLVRENEMTIADDLSKVLEKMQTALVANAPRYHADVVKDADLYLAVARSLLDGGGGVLGADPEPIVARAVEAKGIGRVTLFGRDRMVDFSFYAPRGMYENSGLEAYFRAMVWLTRLELNVSSRGAASSAPALDPRETPREATLALVLADLAEQAKVSADIANMNRFFRMISGKREDVPLDALAAMQKQHAFPLDDPDAAAKGLRAAIGESYPRTINQHVRTYWAERLPAIATFFGVGITPDAPSVSALASKERPRVVRASEVAFALGQDRARRYAKPDLHAAQLDASRALLAKAPKGPDLYGHWLGAVRALADKPAGATPSFFATDAFADTRVASTIAGFGQVRHAYVLHAVQVYEEGGCVIPDGYVEPAVGVYDAILAYAERLAAERAAFGKPEMVDAYVARVRLYVGVLRSIAQDELAGRALGTAQLAFLRMVAEYIDPGRGYSARTRGRFNGWYPHLFAASQEAFENAAFVADFYTAPYNGYVSYAGAREPRLGIFVVDTGGAPRVMVGPVTRALETIEPLGKVRSEPLNGLRRSPGEKVLAPYEASYMVARPKRSAIEITEDHPDHVVIETTGFEGDVTVERVDEHEAILAKATVHVTKREKTQSVPLPSPSPDGRESRGVRIRLPNGRLQHDVYRDGDWEEPAPTW